MARSWVAPQFFPQEAKTLPEAVKEIVGKSDLESLDISYMCEKFMKPLQLISAFLAHIDLSHVAFPKVESLLILLTSVGLQPQELLPPLC